MRNQIPGAGTINPNKATEKTPAVTIEGADFTLGTKTYRGGPFIIPAEYVNPMITNLIATWRAKGVVVDGPTKTGFTAPVYENVTSMPNTVLDQSNGGKIISAFYTPSEVPATSYVTGTPASLQNCEDVYGMPHADPQNWDAVTRAKFLNFILGGGSLFAACHSVSGMEAYAPTYLGFNLLTTSSLIRWGGHINKNTPPFAYNIIPPSILADPMEQFVGQVDL